MAIQTINRIADYDVNNGVTENTGIFKYTAPSMVLSSGTDIIKNMNRFHNEAFTFWVYFADATASKFEAVLGTDVNGSGVALRFDFSASYSWIRLVQVTNFGNPTYDSVIVEKDVRLIEDGFQNNTWYKCVVYLADDMLKVEFNGVQLFEIETFVPNGTYFGFSGLDTSNNIYISDATYYSDQVFWGNVNLNGVPDDQGQVLMLKQSTFSLIGRDLCNSKGEWLIFLEDDPANVNKYILIGHILDRPTYQPRGVGNITL